MLTRKTSKSPNVYKLEIELSHRNYHIEYFSALGKIDNYLIDYASKYFPNEVMVISMSRLQINEENNYGVLIDSGKLENLEFGLEFPIKIFRLKIK